MRGTGGLIQPARTSTTFNPKTERWTTPAVDDDESDCEPLAINSYEVDSKAIDAEDIGSEDIDSE